MPPGAAHTYGLDGEDRVMFQLLGAEDRSRQPGFYVDVGAHHPWLYSNTYVFYCRGWRGINIDPMPASMEPFRELRPRDINLEIAIGEKREHLSYYEFEEPAFNGFMEKNAIDVQKEGLSKLVKTHSIETLPLAEVLDRHAPPGQTIDFMSVDVEGFDEVVLRSNDWDRFRPGHLIVEILDFGNWKHAQNLDIVRYLDECGYELCARTGRSVIFKDTRRRV
ncbi:MAG: FkbM family methyltransferase [Opitutaceae bacterium]